ncbi:MAG: hypothetical protein KME29_16790 [Calothrix sp. FI2-JRJ7]|jgi:hypothetical protein|nr:hypothetical protein [Calothrix sp. FI2-JRJ7]
MCELKYFVACTVDKFIACKDDSYDFFLMEGEQVAYLHENFPETIPALSARKTRDKCRE